MNKICTTTLIVFLFVFLIGIFGVNLISASYGDYVTSWTFGATNTSYDLTPSGGYLWITDNAGMVINKFDINGIHISQFALNSSMTNVYAGITTNGSNIWVGDNAQKIVWMYNMTGENIKKWSLNTNNADAWGMANNGSNIFITDTVDGLIYKYSMEGDYLGTITMPVTDMRGIEIVGNFIYLTDIIADLLYKIYSNGTYISNYTLNSTNTNAYGITEYESFLYVIDAVLDRVFVYDLSDIVINLNSPSDDYQTLSNQITFNCSASTSIFSFLANISLWTNMSGAWVLNETIVVSGTSNNSIFTKNIPTGTWDWTCKAYNNNSESNWGLNRTINVGMKLIENYQTYNTQSYETASETFTINVTANSSLTAANLIYAGTSYAGTQSGLVWSRTIDIPLGSANNNFYWNFTYAGEQISSTSHTQTVNYSTLILCNATYPTAYVNFTFADESTSAKLNASVDLATWTYWLGSGAAGYTKSYIFQNTTHNLNYAFCFAPADKSLTVDLSFKYSDTGYPIRTFTYDNQVLTNTTTNKVLYLLGSADGIYSAIRAASVSGFSISGVLIQYERQIGGVWVLLGQEVTGDDGIATFWVNPNYEYRFTASKTGYTTTQVTVQPSQTQYTLTMASAQGGAYISFINGIKWEVRPGSGSLNTTTNQKFNATIISSLANLESCKFELVNQRNISEVLATSTSITNSSYCQMIITYTTATNQRIFGRLYVDTTNTTGFVLIDGDSAWVISDFSGRHPWNYLTSIFTEMQSMSEFGEDEEALFNRIIFFFLITTIFIGVFIFFSGVEMSNPGLSLIIIWFIVLIASIGGFLTFYTGSMAYGDTSESTSIPTQYGFLAIFTILVVSYILSLFRRTGE